MGETARYLLGLVVFPVFAASGRIYAWCNYCRARTSVWFDAYGYPVTTVTMRHWTADVLQDDDGIEPVQETVEQRPWR